MARTRFLSRPLNLSQPCAWHVASLLISPITPNARCQMTATFLKVTASYWPGLFHCYDMVDLPRTNNDLEHVFGSTRYHERRATGRKQASPGLVVRGSVRVVATIVTQNNHFSGSDLAPRDLAQWRTLRKQVDYRHEARREQYRFRKDPERYLRALEAQLSQRKMPS